MHISKLCIIYYLQTWYHLYLQTLYHLYLLIWYHFYLQTWYHLYLQICYQLYLLTWYHLLPAKNGIMYICKLGIIYTSYLVSFISSNLVSFIPANLVSFIKGRMQRSGVHTIKYNTYPKTQHGKITKPQENITHNRAKRLALSQPAMYSQDSMTDTKHKYQTDPQKKHRLGTVSFTGGLKQVSWYLQT